MKFTNEYIEMVSKAEEIQKLCKYKKGDWFLNIKDTTTYILYFDKGRFKDSYVKKIIGKDKWLPTLDDLFGMVEGDVIDKLDSFYDWVVVDCTNVILLNNLVDMKEFLLCYVMFDKFNKHWHPDKHQWEAIK